MKMNKYDMARIMLLTYAFKYDWVRDKVKQSGLNLNLPKTCNENEIQDYISLLQREKENEPIEKVLKDLSKKMKKTKNAEEKIKILNAIMAIRKVWSPYGYTD